jgi:membrane fusion protein (multidrug efflux system)
VTSPALPDRILEGVIDVVDPVLDPATRNARVQARLPNPDGRFMPGMSADVSVVLGERQDALTVPSEAVFAEGGQFLVFVINPDSTVMRQAITLGTRLAGSVEVHSGLAPGASVVRAGHQKLFPGAKVMPVVSQPPGAAIPTGKGGSNEA